MKKKTFAIAILLIILATGCSGDLDYMIEEYNSRFGIHDDRTLLLPGDINYDQRNMILEEYHVNVNASLNIPAPRVADANYKWQMYKGGAEITSLSKTENGIEGANFHLLERNLSEDTYILKLTVTVAGKTYTDSALVTVHNEDRENPQTATN